LESYKMKVALVTTILFSFLFGVEKILGENSQLTLLSPKTREILTNVQLKLNICDF
jgi:hypothetical protein